MDENDILGGHHINLYLVETVIDLVRSAEKRIKERLAAKVETRLLSDTRLTREEVESVVKILVHEIQTLETFQGKFQY